MKFLLTVLSILTLPILAQADDGFSVANETTDSERVQQSISDSREIRDSNQHSYEPEKRGIERSDSGYGLRRCANIRARIDEISSRIVEDSDESLRSLPWEGPQTRYRRERQEQEKAYRDWNCAETMEAEANRLDRCENMRKELKDIQSDLLADQRDRRSGRAIPGRKERLLLEQESTLKEGQRYSCGRLRN